MNPVMKDMLKKDVCAIFDGGCGVSVHEELTIQPKQCTEDQLKELCNMLQTDDATVTVVVKDWTYTQVLKP